MPKPAGMLWMLVQSSMRSVGVCTQMALPDIKVRELGEEELCLKGIRTRSKKS